MEVGNPHPTIYLQNINERVKPVDLKKDLANLLEPVGQIVNIVAKRALPLRGQAWIQFDSTESAHRAISFLQGRRLYGKSVVARFAKYKSDSVSKADGTYANELHYRSQEKAERARNPRLTRRQVIQQLMANPAAAMMMSGTAGPMQSPTMSALPVGVGSDMQLPSKILFIQNLPPGFDERTLSSLFEKYAGFIEVRSVPNRPDLAFVEFDTEVQAAMARALDQHEVAVGARIRVTFARR